MRVDGDVVREARKARGMSREELAVAVGVSMDTIARIEQNRGDCAAGTAYLIAQTLEVDLRGLFTKVTAA